ncbi:MAG: hypothetical protein KF715_03045 [Candidatus Didemnitutus sp.]|nr:hypothetical protein [Candidatus Didemnitutus sp.]
MSLINDALKKAQRERGETPSVSNAPMPGGGSAQTARASTKSAGPNPKFLLLGAGALLGVLVALGTVLWLRPASTPAIAATREPRTTDSPTSASVPAANSPAPAAETLSTPAPAKLAEPTSVAKIELPAVAATTPTSAPPSTGSTLDPASSAASAPAPAPAQVSPAPVVQSDPPTPSTRMVEAIEGFRVTGIRAGAGSDAKVLMNDRVFRLGDTVDHSLGIKLIAATPNSLTFRDSAGATYTRNF